MSFDSVSAEIDRILFECDVTKEDLANISIVIPSPAKVPGKKGTKTLTGLVIKKYITFDDKASKEDKMIYILTHLAKATSAEFLIDMKAKDWLTVSYSRPYKDCAGGPVFLVGIAVHDYSRSIKMGRTRFGELNGRFPLHAMTIMLVNKFNSWKKSISDKKELEQLRVENGPTADELEDVDLSEFE